MFGGSKITTLVASICILGIGLIGWKQRDGGLNDLQLLIDASWFPLVLTMRLIEGISIGNIFRKRLGIWLPIALIVPMIGAAYVVLVDVPIVHVAYLKAVLIVIGALLASVFLVNRLKGANVDNESGLAFVGFAILLTFCSASLYMSTDTKMFAIYTYLFPVGIITGIISGKKIIEETA